MADIIHAWNDALALAKTLDPGYAVEAVDLLMVRTPAGVQAWGQCPMTGLQLLDPDPQPVMTTPEVEKFVRELQQSGLSRLDFSSRAIRHQWQVYLDGGALGEALRTARQGM